ncbi:MAG: amidohydrolase family protein, partial [Acidimicrobiales bacterium]
MTDPSRTTTATETPRPCDLVIGGGWILDLDGPEEMATARRSVAIASGEIVDIGPDSEISERWRPTQRVDATGHVVAPGFVDAHVHLGAFLGAGRPYERPTDPSPFSGSGQLEDALRTVAGFCSMAVPAEVVVPVLRPVLAAMLEAGFTGVVDAGGPGWDGVWQAAVDSGIRAAIGPSLADSWHDEDGRFDRRADSNDLLAAAESFVVERRGASDRVRPLISAVETMGASDELLAGIAALAERHDLPTHVHSHIGEESATAHETLLGARQTERLVRTGMLSPRCTVMHATALTDQDIGAFATAGATVNHNPVGNALYGFGAAAGRAVPRLLDAGVPVVLGSDWAPTVTNPFEIVRFALGLHRDIAADDRAISLEAALAMSTAGSVPLGCPGGLGRILELAPTDRAAA